MVRPIPGNDLENIRSSRFFAKLADIYREKGELDRAIKVLGEGLEKNPDYITARIILAACFVENGDPESALHEYERILELDPFHAVALKNLSKLLVQAGKHEDAVMFIQNYLDEVPGDEEMKVLLADLDSREGSAPVDKAEDAPGVDNPVLTGESVNEDKENDIEEKTASDAQSREVEQTDAETLNTEGLSTGGQVSESAEEIIATMTLAEIYASQGFYEKAIEVYQKVLLREPSNEVARKKIEAIRRGELTDPGGKSVKREEHLSSPAETEGDGIDYTGGDTPGEVYRDEEYEQFKKWLGRLTRKKSTKGDQ
jgi:lipopolysaccharide biosynthesis regulator YciM